MRTSLSLLISSLAFSSLTINCSVVNSSSFVALADSSSQQLVSAKPQPSEPESPTPYRGGGRRDLIQSKNARSNG
ncbi:hypothetical protein I8752_10625 [Nostocaceae cyanobacterium CENA369]|uniref:Uncharacterized protein n=1 Tax=Dendronalium phyllosphericum CENA369 TaxID=1725256 RepID=A0A8J7LDV0_9NOST|nr:hypothetical protein [Dendronalium phyllosphericum]MBH8573461.1 hypothetical protein [Dendronalium phyllosphericum CENA369]